MFLINLTYERPLTEVEKYLEEHIAFLDKYYTLSKFIFSGRKNPRTGGIILAHNCTDEEIKQIISEDPFFKNEIATYHFQEFIITKYVEPFSVFIENSLGGIPHTSAKK